MRIARILAVALAVAALAMLLASGPGTRAGWWEWRFGLSLLRYAVYVGGAAALVSLVLVVLTAVPKWRVRPWLPVLALCIALLAVAPPLILLGQAKAVPPIHDITTDVADPPAFVALLEARNQSPNGAAYGGPAVAAQQQKAYPDVKPLVIAAPPGEAMQKALDAARSMSWEVRASDTASGRLEATATTTWFGFKDDVVVRIRPQGTGSRIDVRSVSRVGVSDVGANAKRIREFLSRLT
jgi:uncharacterized protein (DUF1499 family)